MASIRDKARPTQRAPDPRETAGAGAVGVCAFSGSLQYFTFEVPAPPPGEEDYCSSAWPGFSVNMLTAESGGNMHGYEETPTVQVILDVTNPLLESVK